MIFCKDKAGVNVPGSVGLRVSVGALSFAGSSTKAT